MVSIWFCFLLVRFKNLEFLYRLFVVRVWGSFLVVVLGCLVVNRGGEVKVIS